MLGRKLSNLGCILTENYASVFFHIEYIKTFNKADALLTVDEVIFSVLEGENSGECSTKVTMVED